VSILIRLLLVAGILCLGMNFLGVVFSYYSTLNSLSNDPEASLDGLTSRASQVQNNPWLVSGWTVLGLALIATAIGLTVGRIRRRSRSS
jgi:hypothetical protein